MRSSPLRNCISISEVDEHWPATPSSSPGNSSVASEGDAMEVEMTDEMEIYSAKLVALAQAAEWYARHYPSAVVNRKRKCPFDDGNRPRLRRAMGADFRRQMPRQTRAEMLRIKDKIEHINRQARIETFIEEWREEKGHPNPPGSRLDRIFNESQAGYVADLRDLQTLLQTLNYTESTAYHAFCGPLKIDSYRVQPTLLRLACVDNLVKERRRLFDTYHEIRQNMILTRVTNICIELELDIEEYATRILDVRERYNRRAAYFRRREIRARGERALRRLEYYQRQWEIQMRRPPQFRAQFSMTAARDIDNSAARLTEYLETFSPRHRETALRRYVEQYSAGSYGSFARGLAALRVAVDRVLMGGEEDDSDDEST
ncbi:hypothetical protein GLAREA_12455 [Glarea lozoyensis ATCC 20868]|uniref:Uncharacterized protein n=1 Tax=Glarea lozoyensis (strain ATCC 20868 / MF5171) TaxID=1116229 RepID=S3D3G6_GLAL2|nr:uncharacterized protein GLAREA_12455 [Glarea lozoyensis ATCC 20868]EPE31699.1 hypothetical protein GLAREA_12455 [Glarea lozoyensis ATCC 20868]